MKRDKRSDSRKDSERRADTVADPAVDEKVEEGGVKTIAPDEDIATEVVENSASEPVEGNTIPLEEALDQLRMERENVEQLKAQLQQATSEKESWMNKYYSSLADVQNLRKDIQKEGDNARKFAAEPVLKKLIPFMQSMDQAFRYEPTDDPKSASWIRGIHMAYRQLIKALEELEIKEIDPAPGDAFDAYTMEAMDTVESKKPDRVHEVLMRGFTLHGRLIQPATVVVTVKPRKHQRAEDEGRAEESAVQSDIPASDAEELETVVDAAPVEGTALDVAVENEPVATEASEVSEEPEKQSESEEVLDGPGSGTEDITDRGKDDEVPDVEKTAEDDVPKRKKWSIRKKSKKSR